MSEKPSKALTKFRNNHCPDVSIRSPDIIYKLLEKIVKKNKK